VRGRIRTVTTIQGLLILSGRQCAIGKTTEGWAYLGMALHLLTDAGFHLCLKKQMLQNTLTAADMEQRRRLCISAFTSDKTLCLCLGRPPSITNLPESLEEVLDDIDDEEMWAPAGFPAYPATRSYTTACCRQFYKLCKMVPMVFSNLHLAGRQLLAQPRITALQQQLQSWYDGLPGVLKMDHPGKSHACPPLHILSLNLLYRTLQILAWRSNILQSTRGDTCHQVMEGCIEQSEKMHQMFLLCGNTFNWSNMTYLVNYCVYTAASVDATMISSSKAEVRARAVVRLGVALRLLEGEVKQTPGVRCSIDILKKRLELTGLARGDDTSIRMSTSSSPQADDVGDASAASSSASPARATTTSEDVPTLALPGPPIPSGDARDSELHDQLQEKSFSDAWGLSLTDVGTGFQPDSFTWELDESLHRSEDWWGM
jgi:hypothetical protein